jgi:hypothetical protein
VAVTAFAVQPGFIRSGLPFSKCTKERMRDAKSKDDLQSLGHRRDDWLCDHELLNSPTSRDRKIACAFGAIDRTSAQTEDQVPGGPL